MAGQLIANARMYSVAPGAIASWKRLFAWLQEASGVPLDVIDHAFPAKLNDLWLRDDLGATFMCGWPWLRLAKGHQVVAAPVPSASYAEGRPVYCTHFVVRTDSGLDRIEDTFGRRFAFTIDDSHSGYNAPRRFLMTYRKDGKPMFGEIIGPLTTPRRMVEAIAEGRTDVGPLDSFAWALLCQHEPELTRPLKVIASTPVVPIPAIMASRATDPSVVGKLRAALLAIGHEPDQRDLLADLCIRGFAPLDPASYEIAETWAREAEAAGLERIT